MKKLIYAVAMLCSITTVANAEDRIFNHLGGAVGIGLTTGIELELAAPITEYVQVRAGMSIVPKIKISGMKMNVNEPDGWSSAYSNIKAMNDNIDDVRRNGAALSADEKNAISELATYGFPSDLEAKAYFKNVNFKLLFDIYPKPDWSFHFTTGFFVGNSEILSANTTNCEDQLQAITDYNSYLAGNTYTYGTRSVSNLPQVVGEFEGQQFYPNGPRITSYCKVNSFKPYVGVGFGRAVPKKTRLAFACDMGVQFWGTPTIYIQDDKLKGDADDDFVKAVSKISVYPVVSFRLCGKIL